MSKKPIRRDKEAVEWIGGLAQLSTVLEVGGVSIQPEILLWMNEEGAVAGYHLGPPGTMLDTAVESLCEAMADPVDGKAGLPQRLRVASPRLAEALEELRPRIEVVCAPTPELDGVLDSIEKDLSIAKNLLQGESGSLPKLSASSVGLEASAGLLQAAVRLHKLKPWTVVPDFRHSIMATVHHCGYRGGFVLLFLDEDGVLNVTLLGNRDDLKAMVACMEEEERENRELEALGDQEIDEHAWFYRPRLKRPPFVTLKFNPGTQPPTSSAILSVRKGGWEPAAPDSSIWLFSRDREGPARDPTAREALLMEAILLALPGMMQEEEALRAGWEDDVPFVRTYTAETHAGPLMVLLGVS